MLHFYDGYHFLGMHLLWWAFWLAFIWILFGAFELRRKQKAMGR